MNITGSQPYQKGQKHRNPHGKSERESPWFKVGTDKEFHEWLRKQPSAIDGSVPCVVAHVRRSVHAGTGFKPVYSAVPLTYDQHNEQSWHGEASCLNRFMPTSGGWTNIDAKLWFDRQANLHLEAWARSTGLYP